LVTSSIDSPAWASCGTDHDFVDVDAFGLLDGERDGPGYLRFELRNGNTPELVTHNMGPSEARNVAIWGLLSPSQYGYHAQYGSLRDSAYGLLREPYETIPAGDLRVEPVSVHEWQILYGVTRWNLRIDWDDDAGGHSDQKTEATKW
jgi:hypothetical protein